MCQALLCGIVDKDLEYLEEGGLCHSRWLTLEYRILRCYVSKTKPSKKLRILVEYLVDLFSMLVSNYIYQQNSIRIQPFFYAKNYNQLSKCSC